MGIGLLGIGFGLFLNKEQGKLSAFENFLKRVKMLLLENSQRLVLFFKGMIS